MIARNSIRDEISSIYLRTYSGVDEQLVML